MAPQPPEQSIEQSADSPPPPAWTCAHTATLQLVALLNKMVRLDDMMGHIAARHPQVNDYGVAGEIQGVAQEIPTKRGVLVHCETAKTQRAHEKSQEHADSTPGSDDRGGQDNRGSDYVP